MSLLEEEALLSDSAERRARGFTAWTKRTAVGTAKISATAHDAAWRWFGRFGLYLLGILSAWAASIAPFITTAHAVPWSSVLLYIFSGACFLGPRVYERISLAIVARVSGQSIDSIQRLDLDQRVDQHIEQNVNITNRQIIERRDSSRGIEPSR